MVTSSLCTSVVKMLTENIKITDLKKKKKKITDVLEIF